MKLYEFAAFYNPPERVGEKENPERPKIIVEPKKQTMKRTQEDSPNRADAFLLTLASEAVTAAGTDGRNTVGWNQPLQREIKGIV